MFERLWETSLKFKNVIRLSWSVRYGYTGHFAGTYVVNDGDKLQLQSLHGSQMADQAGAYLGFCSMKRVVVVIFPHVWDVSPSQGAPPPPPPPQAFNLQVPIYILVERGTVRGQGSNPDRSGDTET